MKTSVVCALISMFAIAVATTTTAVTNTTVTNVPSNITTPSGSPGQHVTYSSLPMVVGMIAVAVLALLKH